MLRCQRVWCEATSWLFILFFPSVRAVSPSHLIVQAWTTDELVLDAKNGSWLSVVQRANAIIFL
jgi:hypothetical protein